MITFRRQRGAALFVGILLITVVVVLAAVVALTAGTQHLGQARTALAEQAWYAAMARLESGIQQAVTGNVCPAGGSAELFGFATTLTCTASSVSEGGMSYAVYNLEVTASQGTLSSPILVRRSVRSQVTDQGE